jgi:hypothetical protein
MCARFRVGRCPNQLSSRNGAPALRGDVHAYWLARGIGAFSALSLEGAIGRAEAGTRNGQVRLWT